MFRLSEKIPQLSSFSIFFLITVLQKLVSIFTTPLFAKYFRPEEYGVLSLSQSVSAIGVILLFLGTSDSIYVQTLGGEGGYLNRVKSILVFQTLISIVCSIAIYLHSYSELGNIELSYLLISQVLNYVLSTHLLFLQAKVENIQRYVLVSFFSILFPLIFSVLFVVYGNEGFFGYSKGQLFGNLIGLIGTVFVQRDIFIQNRFSKAELLRSISHSVPFFFHAFSHWGKAYSDRVVMNFFLPKEEMGIVYMGTLYASALLFSMEPFRIINNKNIYKFLSSGEEYNPAPTSRNSMITYSTLGLFLSLLSGVTFSILLPPTYLKAVCLIPYLVSCLLFYFIYYILCCNNFEA
jgi:O-antigen/teichoic acid export membrane protein